MTLTRDTISVWTNAHGMPEHVIIGSTRYRVTDRPTALESGYDLAATHPAGVPEAWRFQGTDDDGHSMMIEARPIASRTEWLLLRTYQ